MTVRTIERLLGYNVLYFLCWVLALVAGLVVVSHLTLRSERASILR